MTPKNKKHLSKKRKYKTTRSSNMKPANKENEISLERTAQTTFDIDTVEIPSNGEHSSLTIFADGISNGFKNEDAQLSHENTMPDTKTNPPREYIRLIAIEKLTSQLKLYHNRDSLAAVIKSVLSATKGDIEKKNIIFEILQTFLGIMEYSSQEDLKATSVKFRGLFIPRQLMELTIENSELDSFMFVGRGGFGEITKGILRKADGSLERVAIKSPLKKQAEREIKNEAIVLSQLVHKNVVRLLGFQKNPIKIALEFMDMKDVTKVLRNYNLSPKQLLNIFLDVACGMEYVADKKFIHRDLTCRNIFVNSRLECKIGDFGFCVFVGDSDGVYEDEHLSGYHMSPEVTERNIFTSKSDVWAMGILIWEVYITASGLGLDYFLPMPFGLQMFPLSGIIKLDMPSKCPPYIRSYVVNDLLNDDQEQRPTFSNIKRKISEILKEVSN